MISSKFGLFLLILSILFLSACATQPTRKEVTTNGQGKEVSTLTAIPAPLPVLSSFAVIVKGEIEPDGRLIAWGHAKLPPDNRLAEWVMWESPDFVVHEFSQPIRPDFLELLDGTGWSPYLLQRGTSTSLQMTAGHYSRNQKCGFSGQLPIVDAEAVKYQCYLFGQTAGIQIDIDELDAPHETSIADKN